MGDIDINDYVGRFEFVEFGRKVPEGDFARFVVSLTYWKQRCVLHKKQLFGCDLLSF